MAQKESKSYALKKRSVKLFAASKKLSDGEIKIFFLRSTAVDVRAIEKEMSASASAASVFRRRRREAESRFLNVVAVVGVGATRSLADLESLEPLRVERENSPSSSY